MNLFFGITAYGLKQQSKTKKRALSTPTISIAQDVTLLCKFRSRLET
jgi:hypothetical protein